MRVNKYINDNYCNFVGEMERLVVAFGGMVFSVLLILLALSLVLYSSSLHASFLESEQQLVRDKQITSFLVSGDTANLPYMTANEVSHMEDVAWLGTTMLYLIAGLLSVLTFLVIHMRPEERFAMVLSPALLFILLQTALIQFFTDFSDAFLKFHEVFFPQGNFMFPVDSVLISTYNESFFAGMTLLFALLILALWLIAVALALWGEVVHLHLKKPMVYIRGLYSYKKLGKRQKAAEDLILQMLLAKT